MKFPDNPSNGTIFESDSGTLYVYDASINTWIRSGSALLDIKPATISRPGLMSKDDYKKIAGLVLPPLQTSIKGESCQGTFKRGVIGLQGSDDYIKVNGVLDVKNIDEIGESISSKIDFNIHNHTSGFEFTVDTDKLTEDLIARQQVNVVGQTGPQGLKGVKGEQGESQVFAGPVGRKGPVGTGPACGWRAEPEPFDVNAIITNNEKVITDVQVVEDGEDFKLVFIRRLAGNSVFPAQKFEIRPGCSSPWLLAVSSPTNSSQSAFYFDVEPIINSIRAKFVEEATKLRIGYQDIVAFWTAQMQLKFETQKRALCCALQFCLSKTKNDELRRHIESVAATALGKGKIRLNTKDSNGVEILSGNGLLASLGYEDPCSLPVTQELVIAKQDLGNLVVLEAAKNSGSFEDGILLELAEGDYIFKVEDTNSWFLDSYSVPVRIRFNSGDSFSTIQFLNKGSYKSEGDSRNAYVGQELLVRHKGGPVSIYYYKSPASVAGSTSLSYMRAATSNSCKIDTATIDELNTKWQSRKLIGVVLKLGMQDYIVCKLPDAICDGKAIAWPTFDGQNLATVGEKFLSKNKDLEQDIINKIYNDEIGFATSAKNMLMNELVDILFPL